MSIINAILKSSLEGLETTTPVSEGELQATAVDVEEAHQEVQSIIEAESRLSNAANALTALQIVPVSGDGTIAAIANESIMLSIGVEGLGLEEAESTLAKIWAAIKNFVIKIIESVKNFFGKLTSGLNGIKKQFEELKSDIKNVGLKINSKYVDFKCDKAIDLQFGSYDAEIGRTITGMGIMNTQLVRLFKAHSLLSSSLSDDKNIDNETVNLYLQGYSKAIHENDSMTLIGGWKVDISTGKFESTAARDNFASKGSHDFRSNYQGALDLVQQCLAVIETLESKYSLTTAGFNKVTKQIAEFEAAAKTGDDDAKTAHSNAQSYRRLITLDVTLITRMANITNTALHASVSLLKSFVIAGNHLHTDK